MNDEAPSLGVAAERGEPTQTQNPPEVMPPQGAPRIPTAMVGGLDEADFVVRQNLGRGGMGIVELASQSSLQREVALKRLSDPEDVAGFHALLREARITSRLEHPGIVPIHGVFQDPQLGPVVVMKRVEGTTWRAKMYEAGADSDPRAHARIAIEVCFALEYAHSRGVLHLDVKPDNVIVGEYGEVCLVDWGIALDRREGSPRRPLGTPSYMAPEMVASDAGPLSEASDVYLLGGCLFEALFGHPPHQASTDSESMIGALEGVGFPESSLGQPSEIVGICRRALATDPNSRFERVHALRRALESFLEHQDAERLVTRVLSELNEVEGIAELRDLEVRLQQALSLWPHNPRGLAAERILGHRMLETHVQNGDLTAARHTAGSLPWVPPDLYRGLVALQTQREEERAALDQQVRDTDATDFRVQASFRQWVMLLITLILVALPFISHWRSPGSDPSPAEHLVVYGLLANLAWLSAVAFWRARFFVNFANRAATLGVTAAFAAPLLNRASGLVRHADPADILRSDLVIIAAVLTAMAALDRVFGLLAAVCALGCIVSSFEPGLTRYLYNGIVILCALTVHIRWQRMGSG